MFFALVIIFAPGISTNGGMAATVLPNYNSETNCNFAAKEAKKNVTIREAFCVPMDFAR